jgi:hypothetical protein
MSDTDTKYEVSTDYVVHDHASDPLHHIQESAEHTAEAVESLKHGLQMVAEVTGLYSVISKAKDAFLGFNSAVEQSQLKLATMITANYVANWDQATKAAEEMRGKFQEIAETVPVTANEMSQFADRISSAYKGNLNDLAEFSARAAVISKVMVGSAEGGAMQITRMLAGQVSERQAMGKALLNSMGMNSQQWKALTAEQRTTKLSTAVQSDTFKDMQKTLGDTYQGVTEVFKDKVEVTLARIGMPLFKAITAEVKSWSEWMDKNKDKLDEIGRTITSSLITGFHAIKDVFTFIYDHADILMTIGKLYAATAVGGMIGGALGNAGSGIAGMLSKFGAGGSMMAPVTGGSAMGSAGLIGAAGALGFAFGHLLNDTLGLSTAIADSAASYINQFTGQEDYEKKLRDVTNTMDVFDHSVLEAGKRLDKIAGGGGSVAVKNLTGMADFHKGQADAIRTVLKEQKSRGGPSWLDYGMSAAGMDQSATKNAIADAANRATLKGAGLSDAEIEQIMANNDAAAKIADAAAMNATRDSNRVEQVIGATNEALKQVPKDIIAGSEEYKKIADAISLTINSRTKFDPNGGEIGGVGGISADEIKKIVEGNKEDALKRRDSVNQTVNVNINQVSAKDPDRFIADIDDMAGRLMNRPRRAKSSLATKMGPGY